MWYPFVSYCLVPQAFDSWFHTPLWLQVCCVVSLVNDDDLAFRARIDPSPVEFSNLSLYFKQGFIAEGTSTSSSWKKEGDMRSDTVLVPEPTHDPTCSHGCTYQPCALETWEWYSSFQDTSSIVLQCRNSVSCHCYEATRQYDLAWHEYSRLHHKFHSRPGPMSPRWWPAQCKATTHHNVLIWSLSWAWLEQTCHLPCWQDLPTWVWHLLGKRGNWNWLVAAKRVWDCWTFSKSRLLCQRSRNWRDCLSILCLDLLVGDCRTTWSIVNSVDSVVLVGPWLGLSFCEGIRWGENGWKKQGVLWKGKGNGEYDCLSCFREIVSLSQVGTLGSSFFSLCFDGCSARWEKWIVMNLRRCLFCGRQLSCRPTSTCNGKISRLYRFYVHPDDGQDRGTGDRFVWPSRP